MNRKACPEINELLKQSAVDLTKRKPQDVWNRLPRIRDSGELARKCGEHKKAFILFNRWMHAVEWIKKTKEYKQNASQYAAHMSSNQINEVKSALEELEKTLTAPNDVIITDATLSNNTSGTDWLKMPETPIEEPLETESNDFVSCIQVFQQMQCSNRYLIIDIRTKEDYTASRIKSQMCINIPESQIQNGQTGGILEKLLMKEDKDMFTLFQRRSSEYVDIIILLDWRTTKNTPIEWSRLHTLKNILKQWDFTTKKSTQISILDGGYTEWLNRYPAYTTNPNVKDPDNQANAMDEILEEVEFPVWLNLDDEKSPFNGLRIEPLPKKRSNQSKINVTSYARDDSMERNVDKSLHSTTTDLTVTRNNGKNRLNDSTNDKDLEDSIRNPYEFFNKEKSELSRLSRKFENRNTENMHIDEDDIPSQTTKLPNKSIIHDVAPKPTVDRSCKPSNLSNQYSDCAALLRLMNQLLELLKNEAQFEHRVLSIEHERFYRSVKDIQDFNNHSEAEFTLLEAKLDEVRRQKSKIRSALAKQKFEDLVMSAKDMKEKDKLDVSIGSIEQQLKTISIDRKKLYEKIAANEEQKFAAKQKRNDNSIHKESLKPEGLSRNSGLKRSHSSPNLAQLDDRKAPLVDRSSKPQPEIHVLNNTMTNINTRYSMPTWRDREQRMDPIFRNGNPGITGLKNLGNSCYMNSIIQCLSNTAYLTKYFIDNMYLNDLNTSNDNSTHGHVAEEVAQVIKALWRGQYKSISPRDLKGVIGQYKLQFHTYEQQDSHEFLTFLLDWMHNDLKKGVKIGMHGPLSAAEKEWDKAMENQESIISHLFFGQLKSIIRCSTCGNSSTTYETFNSLTMSLPHSNRCTLDDCVKKYISGQTVSGWKCPSCKLQREAVKKFDFVKLAPIVVIHLNRFAESEGWLEKKNTSVDFPLTDFNMKSYLASDTESANTINQSHIYNYSLYAVSNHYGTMDGGHYTAFCKSATLNKWFKYDDQTVNEVSPSQVKCQNTSAYLLFYTSFPYEPYTFT